MDGQREVRLPCGHQYMAEGLGVAVLTCPDCNVNHTVDLRNAHDLPPDLDLLKPSPCPVHGDPLKMWCKDCEEPACGLCVFDKHPMQSHKVIVATTYINSIRANLLTRSHKLLRQTMKEMIKNENSFLDSENTLLRLFQESQALHLIDNDLRSLIPFIEAASGSRSLHLADRELKRIQVIAWKIPFDENTDDDASFPPQSPVEAASSGIGALSLWTGQISGGQARLMWHADRLLLCAFSGSSPHSQPILQLVAVHSLGEPEFPEVFLELSVGTEPLGIVYIKLWGHLRRAQNFMFLCLGTLGPSFVGSHLLPVTMPGSPSEAVGAGMYRDAKGKMTAMPLLTGLEWGGEYQVPETRGLLVASSGGRPEMDSLYSIITGSGSQGVVCPCKFGWVSSGLEYLREAARYDPVEQVRVSQCGLVLPRL
ncbi:uncharacterized protein LOC123513554 [Portunus trituberculatus]|uniref:uncharacterized protein LOC123513554 n=1 Tax=Portunus trituberculatus TaxID=210409 RepID=UPI001E1CB307|nr:uncharacterized protein LOC123513554 [Portunus trituberculatus]XP_045126723.1 uncharacterized protein LOC123513554 [Portunus trituberculatus]XP_045126724.1 uncharacterized protein LOC123513554 [Portunus trituberculatus]